MDIKIKRKIYILLSLLFILISIVDLRKTTLNQIKEGKRRRNYRGASYKEAYVVDREESLIEE